MHLLLFGGFFDGGSQGDPREGSTAVEGVADVVLIVNASHILQYKRILILEQ